MINLEDDPVLGRFFNTPEKKARWIVRLKYAYILWIVFIILGILSLLIWSFMK